MKHSDQLIIDLQEIIDNVIISKNDDSSYDVKIFKNDKIKFKEFHFTKLEVNQKLSQEIIYYYFYKRLRNKIIREQDLTNKFRSIYNTFKPDCQSGWKIEKGTDNNGNVVIQKRDFDFKLALSGSFFVDEFPLKKGIDIFPRWFAITQIKEKLVIALAKEPEEEDSFIHYSGNHLPDNYGDVSSNIRFYFNLNCEANNFDSIITDFISTIITDFNERFIPFIFKILRNKSKFIRADSAVLYLNKRHFYCIFDLIKKLSHNFDSILNDETVMFALKIGKGIGFAEQPPLDENDKLDFITTPSFGMHRSAIITIAMIALVDENKDLNTTNLVKFLNNSQATSFGNADYFHLNHTLSKYNSRYFFSDFKGVVITKDSKIAEKIAFKLYSESIWDFSGRCNWLSYQSKGVYNTVDTDLIEGLAGICLFLNYLYDITKKEIHLTFLNATVKNLDYKLADRFYFTDKKHKRKKSIRNGYFKGDLMPIYILRKFRKGKWTNNYNIQKEYKPLERVNKLEDTNSLGLWDGRSGTIISLLKLFVLDKEVCYKEKAIELGEGLLNIESIDNIEINILNGTGGIILALLFLYHITNDENYITKAKYLANKENETKSDGEWKGKDASEYYRPYIGNVLVDMPISRLISKEYFNSGTDLEEVMKSFLIKVNHHAKHDILDFKLGLFNFVNSELREQFDKYENEDFKVDLFLEKIEKFIQDDMIFCNSLSNEDSKGFRPDLFHGYAGLGYFVLKHTQNEIKLPSILFPFFKEGEFL
jgi:hypothetical protein